MTTAGGSPGRSTNVGLVALLMALAATAACAGEKKQKKQTSSAAPRPVTRPVSSAAVAVTPPSVLDVIPKSADYVAVRRRGGTESASSVVAEWRRPCTRAKDVVACQARLAGASLQGPIKSKYGYIDGRKDLVLYDVVFTEGDAVGIANSDQELLDLFGKVDTACEAELLVYALDMPLYAYDDFKCTGAARKEGASYVMSRVVRGDCRDGKDERWDTTVDASGSVSTRSVLAPGSPCYVSGRRPPALRTSGGPLGGVGAFFAHAAHLEAASVPAFRHLARELAAHGAPPQLVHAALVSAKDEVRHAHAMAGLARRYGAVAPRPIVGKMPVRSLVDVAIDNAREGCVRETFGAVVAGVQAHRAADRVVRRALARIALDEARHASLAWSIEAWIARRLTPRDRGRTAEARRTAADELAEQIGEPQSKAITHLAGVPTAAVQHELLAKLRAVLPIG